MKDTDFVSCGDPRIRYKHQTLLQDYHELRMETELKRRTLEMIKQKRSTLIAEVRFLRRRYKHLKQDQTLENTPEMLRLSEPAELEVPSKPSVKRKAHSGLKASVPCFDLKQKNRICNEKESLAHNASCDLEKKLKRSRIAEVLTNSISLPDLNGDENNLTKGNVSGFDLNQISREEEEPEASGEHIVVEATKNGINGVHSEIKLPIFKDVEKELNRTVKRKVSWQDPVALTLSV